MDNIKLEVFNRENSNEIFSNRMLKFYKEDEYLFFSNYPGFQKFVKCKISELPFNVDIKNYHYMAISFNEIYTKKEKIKNAFACLIDIDANDEESRNEVINYANLNYGNKILATITKSPKPISKHRFGCHILIYCNKDEERYKDIFNDFKKFECVDKHLYFFCVKNPMYKYFLIE